MINWHKVEKFYNNKTTPGFILAMLESEKIFQEKLKEKKLPENSEARNKFLDKNLTAPEKLSHARGLVYKLKNLEFPSNVSEETTEKVLSIYYTAITEIDELSKSSIKKEQFKNNILRFKNLTLKSLFYVLLLFIVLILLTLFFDQTNFGQNLGQRLVNLSNFIAYKALPVGIGLATILIILVGFSLRSKSKPR